MDNLNKYIDGPQCFEKIYFYVGGVGFEQKFVADTKYTYHHFLSKGFNDEQIKLVINPDLGHNEKAWKMYFPTAIRFFNYLK